jgi:hypothetical protein
MKTIVTQNRSMLYDHQKRPTKRALRTRYARRSERLDTFASLSAGYWGLPSAHALGLGDPVKLDERCSLEAHSPNLRHIRQAVRARVASSFFCSQAESTPAHLSASANRWAADTSRAMRALRVVPETCFLLMYRIWRIQ